MTQPSENPPPRNPESPLDQLDDLGLRFSDDLPPGPLTDAQKQVDYSGFNDVEIAMMIAGELTEPVVAAASIDSTTDEEHTGAMIALVPSSNDKLRMAIPDGEPADQLHTTLLFLGEAADIPEDAQALILDWAKTFAEGRPQVAGNGFALSLFNPAGDSPCWVLEVGEVAGGETPLQDIQSAAASAMANVSGLTMPEQHTPWRPHITLIYDGSIDWAYELVDAAGPVTYDTLRVALGGVVTDFNLLTPSLPDDTTLYSATTEHGGVTMSYHAALRAECPEGLPWAVVRDSDGAILTAHESRAAAESLIDTVSRYELTGGTVSFVAGVAKFSPGAQTYAVEVAPAPPASGTGTVDVTSGPAASGDAAIQPVGSWEAILALEGTPTGDAST